MSSRDRMQAAMAHLAAEHRAAKAPQPVELAVLTEFDALRKKRAGRIAAAVFALAASTAVAAIFVHEAARPHPAPMVAAAGHTDRNERTVVTTASNPPIRPRVRQAPSHTVPLEAPFVPIPYTAPLAPGERASLVRMVLSPSAMAVAGFPLENIDPAGTEADVLVDQEGRARAVRFVAADDFR